MKTVVIIAIAVGVSVAAVLGVLIVIGAYQQTLLEEQQRKEAQALIDLIQKVAESKQKQSQSTQEETSLPKSTSPSQPPASVPPTETKENNCDPSYPDFCIPFSPPDLDCRDIPSKKFTVLPPDPHGFDNDKDGIGCEK